MIYVTRVRFKDGTEENEWWEAADHPGPGQVLTAAVTLAEMLHRDEPHDGAWLETHDKAWLEETGWEKGDAAPV